jgi:hypothetical protein
VRDLVLVLLASPKAAADLAGKDGCPEFLSSHWPDENIIAEH